MGCSPFANSRFQMGVTVMGFAEHFGQYPSRNTYFPSYRNYPLKQANKKITVYVHVKLMLLI